MTPNDTQYQETIRRLGEENQNLRGALAFREAEIELLKNDIKSLRNGSQFAGSAFEEIKVKAGRMAHALQRIRDREYDDTDEEATIMWMQAVATDALGFCQCQIGV